MIAESRAQRFERIALPHLDAAYNLARWLTGNEQDARDVVQDAYLRAFKCFDGFDGENGRAWLLTIVRHNGYSWLRRNRRPESAAADGLDPADELRAWENGGEADPETLLLRRRDQVMLNKAIAELPPEFREVVVLRELEDLSYKDIATIVGIPVGTVMSRLARGRRILRIAWCRQSRKEAGNGL